MALGNGSKKLSELKRDIIIVDREIAIPTLFEKLIETKNHIALVVDEYGTVSGIVNHGRCYRNTSWFRNYG